eukprot:CAMPEP_0184858932 /NCGR_PEP_ID=MMETSP0580-20130426/3957_1 /TAXON_ID=1118495 /ORGANISM="Dactyliosolen fragilissimus" /LENGTH=200 /DNA_ID=CAMNT_0027355295 /DNA_START=207 /DNA_END=806 /DNA_ORIENTATION=+
MVRQRLIAKHVENVMSSNSEKSEYSKQIRQATDEHANPKYRWVKEKHLPPSVGKQDIDAFWDSFLLEENKPEALARNARNKGFRKAYRGSREMDWLEEIPDDVLQRGPKTDFTKLEYNFPSTFAHFNNDGSYPILEKMGDIMDKWPQDDIDNPPTPFIETLQHFDYKDPEQMKLALEFRNNEVPFKIYNVPEIDIATKTW